ncbi:hypothetical protein BKA80DRAFT_67535 [Phyllosticta citrichinensis]
MRTERGGRGTQVERGRDDGQASSQATARRLEAGQAYRLNGEVDWASQGRGQRWLGPGFLRRRLSPRSLYCCARPRRTPSISLSIRPCLGPFCPRSQSLGLFTASCCTLAPFVDNKPRRRGYMAEAITIPSPSVFLSSPVESASPHPPVTTTTIISSSTTPPPSASPKEAPRRRSHAPKPKPIDAAPNPPSNGVTKRKQSKSRNGNIDPGLIAGDKLCPTSHSHRDGATAVHPHRTHPLMYSPQVAALARPNG